MRMYLRRMIGVAAFAYIFAHFLLYTADQAFDVPKIESEIMLRVYLTIGFTALLSLAVLAATSTDATIRRVGRLNWERLHRLVYATGILAVVHFSFQSKLELWEPPWMAGLLGWLLLYRVVARFGGMRGHVSLSWAAGLSVAAALGTALGEATFIHLAYHAPPLLVLQTNLRLTTGLRPAPIVLAVGLAVTLAGALRKRAAERAAPVGPGLIRERRSPLPGVLSPCRATMHKPKFNSGFQIHPPALPQLCNGRTAGRGRFTHDPRAAHACVRCSSRQVARLQIAETDTR